MKFPRFRIRTLMVVVAVSAFIAWGVVRFPRLDHTQTSIVLGILIGAAFWVVPLVAVRAVLYFRPGWHRPSVGLDSPHPED